MTDQTNPETEASGREGSMVTLAEAAEHLEVHYMTAYRYVRTGRLHAEKRGGKWWIDPDDLERITSSGSSDEVAGPLVPTRRRGDLVAPLTARLVASDVSGAWTLVTDAMQSGASPAAVHEELLRPALASIGEQWAAGTLSVSEEHRATAAAGRIIGRLSPLFQPRGRRRGTVVLGAVAGDPHQLPTAMLADQLTGRRFSVVDLGANTPTESFIEAAESIDDVLGVGICVMLDELVAPAVTEIGLIRASLPDTTLVVGGAAVAPAQDRSTDVTTQIEKIRGLVDAVGAGADEVCALFETAADERRVTS